MSSSMASALLGESLFCLPLYLYTPMSTRYGSRQMYTVTHISMLALWVCSRDGLNTAHYRSGVLRPTNALYLHVRISIYNQFCRAWLPSAVVLETLA